MKKIKTGFLYLLAVLVLVAGIHAFFRLKSEKEAYETDPFTLIPGNVQGILYIPDSRFVLPANPIFKLFFSGYLQHSKITNLLPFFEKGILLSLHPEEALIYIKPDSEEYLQTIDYIFRHAYSSFPPKKEKYKEIEIRIFSGKDNDFFCYAYHKGIFIGSYSKKLLEKALDMFDSRENLYSDPILSAYITSIDPQATMNFFIRKSQLKNTSLLPIQEWFACDIEIKEGEWHLNGIILDEDTTCIYSRALRKESEKIISKEMIPDGFATFTHLNPDTSFLKEFAFNPLLSDAVAGEIGVIEFPSPHHTSEKGKIVYIQINKTISKQRLKKITDIHSVSFIQLPFGKKYPLYYGNISGWGIDKLFETDCMIGSYPFTLYKGFLLVGKEADHIKQYILSSDTYHRNSGIEILNDNIKEKNVIFRVIREKRYETLLQLYRNDQTLYFDIIIQPSQQNISKPS